MTSPYVIQAVGFSKYIPNGDSTIPYKFAFMYLTENCVLDVTDHFDHEENGVPFSAGYHQLMFRKIRSISNGSIYLCHNGNNTLTPHMVQEILKGNAL